MFLKLQVLQYSVPYLAIFVFKIPNKALDCRSFCELCVVRVVFLNCLKSVTWCITQCFEDLSSLTSWINSPVEFCHIQGTASRQVFQVSGKCLAFRGASHVPSTFKVSQAAHVQHISSVSRESTRRYEYFTLWGLSACQGIILIFYTELPFIQHFFFFFFFFFVMQQVYPALSCARC